METLKTILELSMGDGYIRPPKTPGANCALWIQHGIKQKDYLFHKKELLSSCGIDSSYNELTSSYGTRCCYILSKRHPLIKEARFMLYNGKQKILTKQVIDYLDERSLAILFQDDGCAEIVKGCVNQFILNVQSFCDDSIQLLSDWLKETCVENKIYKRKGAFVISIAKFLSKLNFVNMMENHICENMRYKISAPLSRVKVFGSDLEILSLGTG